MAYVSSAVDLSVVQESFERAAKRQKLSSTTSQELIDQVIREVELTLSTIIPDDSSSPTSVKTHLTGLRAKLQALGPVNSLEGLQKELNTDLSRHQKNIDKVLHPDLSKACAKVAFDSHVINQIIITHLYREGLLSIVESLMKEANELEVISLGAEFQELHQMLAAIKGRDLDPALNWALAHRATLEKSGSGIEMKIHKLRFVHILQNQTPEEALKYARTHISPFASRHMKDVQTLMGSLLWVGNLNGSPYADLVDPSQWDRLGDELTWRFCDLSRQPLRDPLTVVVHAGEQGLPTLLKLAHVMVGRKQEWEEMKQLSVPLDLGQEFQFHSVFVCPVSREEGSKENFCPAVMFSASSRLRSCRRAIRIISSALSVLVKWGPSSASSCSSDKCGVAVLSLGQLFLVVLGLV